MVKTLLKHNKIDLKKAKKKVHLLFSQIKIMIRSIKVEARKRMSMLNVMNLFQQK